MQQEKLVLVKAKQTIYNDNRRILEGSTFTLKESDIFKKYTADVKDENGKVLHKKGTFVMETIINENGKEEQVYKTSDAYEIVQLNYDPVAEAKKSNPSKIHIKVREIPEDNHPNVGFEQQAYSHKEKSQPAVDPKKKSKDDVI